MCQALLEVSHLLEDTREFGSTSYVSELCLHQTDDLARLTRFLFVFRREIYPDFLGNYQRLLDHFGHMVHVSYLGKSVYLTDE